MLLVTPTFLGIVIALFLVAFVLLLGLVGWLYRSVTSRQPRPWVKAAPSRQERIEQPIRPEVATSREEAPEAKHLREEVGAAVLGAAGDTLVKSLADISNAQRGQLEAFATQLAKLTEGSQSGAREIREEIATSLKTLTESVVASTKETAELQKQQVELFGQRLQALTQTTEQRLDAMREAVEARLNAVQAASTERLDRLRESADESAQKVRDAMVSSLGKNMGEIAALQKSQLEGLWKQLAVLIEWSEKTAELQKNQVEVFDQRLQALTQTTEQKLDAMREAVEARLNAVQAASTERLDRIRESANESAQRVREDMISSLAKNLGEIAAFQKSQLEGFWKQLAALIESGEKKDDTLREVVEERLRLLQAENAAKLDQMRQSVAENLRGTLEKRLGESFELVGDRLRGPGSTRVPGERAKKWWEQN